MVGRRREGHRAFNKDGVQVGRANSHQANSGIVGLDGVQRVAEEGAPRVDAEHGAQMDWRWRFGGHLGGAPVVQENPRKHVGRRDVCTKEWSREQRAGKWRSEVQCGPLSTQATRAGSCAPARALP